MNNVDNMINNMLGKQKKKTSFNNFKMPIIKGKPTMRSMPVMKSMPIMRNTPVMDKIRPDFRSKNAKWFTKLDACPDERSEPPVFMIDEPFSESEYRKLQRRIASDKEKEKRGEYGPYAHAVVKKEGNTKIIDMEGEMDVIGIGNDEVETKRDLRNYAAKFEWCDNLPHDEQTKELKERYEEIDKDLINAGVKKEELFFGKKIKK